MIRLLFVLALTACESRGAAGSQCSADADCKDGLACVLSVCADPALSGPVDAARKKAQEHQKRLQEAQQEVAAERAKLAGGDELEVLEKELDGLKKSRKDAEPHLETGSEQDRQIIRNTIQNLDDAITAHEAKIAALKAR